MSRISKELLNKAAASTRSTGDVPVILYPLIGVVKGIELIGNQFRSIKEKIEKKAEIKSNKTKFKEILDSYIKLSKGKEGQVERLRSEDGSVEEIIIHTKFGPLVKTETNNETNNKKNKTRTSLSFTGIIPITDKSGSEILAYVQDINVGVSFMEWTDLRDSYYTFTTSGTILTEAGLKIDLTASTPVFTTSKEIPPAPKTEQIEIILKLRKDFEDQLKATKNTSLPTSL